MSSSKNLGEDKETLIRIVKLLTAESESESELESESESGSEPIEQNKGYPSLFLCFLLDLEKNDNDSFSINYSSSLQKMLNMVTNNNIQFKKQINLPSSDNDFIKWNIKITPSTCKNCSLFFLNSSNNDYNFYELNEDENSAVDFNKINNFKCQSLDTEEFDDNSFKVENINSDVIEKFFPNAKISQNNNTQYSFYEDSDRKVDEMIVSDLFSNRPQKYKYNTNIFWNPKKSNVKTIKLVPITKVTISPNDLDIEIDFYKAKDAFLKQLDSSIKYCKRSKQPIKELDCVLLDKLHQNTLNIEDDTTLIPNKENGIPVLIYDVDTNCIIWKSKNNDSCIKIFCKSKQGGAIHYKYKRNNTKRYYSSKKKIQKSRKYRKARKYKKSYKKRVQRFIKYSKKKSK